MDTERFVGQQIDQYRIVRHIARGGMADVYLAEDVDLKRKVALKIMLDTLAVDDQFVQRFRREAQIVARLDHPNIVQIYTVGMMPAQPRAAPRPYLAMQYIEGGSLRDKLQQLAQRGKLLTAEQSLNITRQIAEALAMAHQAEVIHRDLKPGNVLIRPDGKPVLVDLGIAVAADVSRLTQTGSIIGTPHYMSPEQVKGAPLDGRSDLYSLGIILYEMLAGVRPFEADSSIAVLHQQVYEEPPPLRQRRPDLPPQVTAVVETCLRKEPAQRFQRAGEMITAIDRALQAAGGHGPNPRATQVLTHLNDSSLISRQQVTPVPVEEEPPCRLVPIWAVVTLLVMVAAVVLLFVLRLFGNGDNPPTATAVINTTQEPAAVPEVAVVGFTPAVAPTDTPVPGTAVPTDPLAITPAPTNTFTPGPTSTPTPTIRPVLPATMIVVQSVTASDYDQVGSNDAQGNQTTFEPENAIDGVTETAWRVPGDGIGEWLELSFDQTIVVERIGIIPGYAKIDPYDGTDRFPQNYAIRDIRLEFSDGMQRVHSFAYTPEMQYIVVDRVETTYIRIVVLDTYAPTYHDPRNFTPISEIQVIGWTR